ncbi:MAG TPA: hypothetical protein VFT84_11700 [Gemmatimonadales bacterium]|nr:hypothetical protein [Gemmatimonadales bacterium]
MAWRVVEHADRRWQVTVAAERRANAAQWTLVFSFRSAPPDQRSFWVTYPLTSLSRAALFAQAEQISDDTLTALVAEHLE